MPLASILLYIKLAGLIFTYGWKLVHWFLDRHDRLEKESGSVVMTSDVKAAAFNRGALSDIQHAKSRIAGRGELNEIRERIWAARNPGKQPKILKDPRLRIRRVGKTASRKR